MRIILALSAALLLANPARADEILPANGCPFTSCRQVATTELRIVPPKHGAVYVFEGHELIGHIGRTATLSVASGRSYEVVATRGPAILWRARLATPSGTIELLWGNGPTPSVRHTPLPPVVVGVPHVPQQPIGMHRKTFRALLQAIEEAHFESDKLQIVRSASAQGQFTVAQVGKILNSFDFESGRLKALATLRPRIVDPENGFLIAEHFTFSSNKKKALALFQSK